MEEEKWKVLNGCNACINSNVCKSHGNCIMLNIDKELPEYTKAKRKLIQRIRTYGNGSMYQIEVMMKKLEKERDKYEVMIRTWDRPVRLTTIEKMFIAELNKPR